MCLCTNEDYENWVGEIYAQYSTTNFPFIILLTPSVWMCLFIFFLNVTSRVSYTSKIVHWTVCGGEILFLFFISSPSFSFCPFFFTFFFILGKITYLIFFIFSIFTCAQYEETFFSLLHILTADVPRVMEKFSSRGHLLSNIQASNH